MKTKRCLAICLMLVSTGILAQESMVGFSYQAVALDKSKAEQFGRDSQGEVLTSTDLEVRFTITEGAPEGSEVYSELHQTSTDMFGLFRLIVGRGERSFGDNIGHLSWGIRMYFLHVEVDKGEGFEYLGNEELLGAPYAMNTNPQTLELVGKELSISGGNAIILEDMSPINELQELTKNGNQISLSNGGGIVIDEVTDEDADPTNELISNFAVNGANIELTDAGGTRQIALSDLKTGIDLDDLNLSLTGNSLAIEDGDGVDLSSFLDNTDQQNLSLSGSDLSISGGTGVDLSALLDGTGTDDQNLTLSSNTLSIESGNSVDLDGLLDNTDTQDLSTDGTAGNVSLTDGGNITINVDDADASATNETITGAVLNSTDLEITEAGTTTTVDLSSLQDGEGTDDQDLSISGNALSIEDGAGVDLSAFLDNTDTQDLSTDGTAGSISLTDGGNITINVDDADAENEIQDLNLDDATDILTITNNTSATDIDLSDYVDNTDTQDLSTDDTAGDISLTDGGNITINVDDADADAENEIQDLNLDGTTNILTITDNAAATDIDLSPYMSPFATADNVTSNENGSYASDDFVFGSPQMDDDGDTDHDNRMFFDKEKGAFRVGNANASQWNDVNVGIGSIGLGFNTEASGFGAVSIGLHSDARGSTSVAIGNSRAEGSGSTAIGNSGAYGYRSVSIGDGSSAFSRAEIGIGALNTNYTPIDDTNWNLEDR